MIDEASGNFTVTSAKNLQEENPDILSLTDVTKCSLDVKEKRIELKKRIQKAEK